MTQGLCDDCRDPDAALTSTPWLRKQVWDGHILFHLTGSTYDMGNLEKLKALIQEAENKGFASIAFALRGCNFLNSTLVNLLVKAFKEAHRSERPAFIVTEDENTRESLQMLGLDRIVSVFSSFRSYRQALSE